MKGTRPLDNNEIRLVSACFTGTFEVRNRSLFLLGVSTGGRISELLSLHDRGRMAEPESPSQTCSMIKASSRGVKSPERCQ